MTKVRKRGKIVGVGDVEMPRRKYKRDVGELLAEGEAVAGRSLDARFWRRVLAVNAVLRGGSVAETARTFGVRRCALSRWLDIADGRGFEALADARRPGRPPRLGDAQTAELKAIVAEDDPKKSGVDVWDGPSLSDFILRRYSVSLKPRQCENLLRKMGFSLVRPRPFPSKGAVDEAARAEFKKKSGGR